MEAVKRNLSEFAVYIDEYKSFGTSRFTDTLAQGRSAGFMITISHQSFADLKAISNEHPEQVRANTNTRIMLRPNAPDSAEQFSSELGTYKNISKTRQIAISGTIEGAEMGSERVVDEYIVHPQEIKQLQIGQAYYKTLHDYGLVILNQLTRDIKNIVLPVPGRTRDVEGKTQTKNGIIETKSGLENQHAVTGQADKPKEIKSLDDL